MTFLERTTDARRLRHWEGDMEADYLYTSGIAGERFFTALRDDGRILTARCPSCEVRFLPPRMYCERCFSELSDYADAPPVGRIAAVTVAHLDRRGHPLAQPEAWALVTFPGVEGGLIHRVFGAPSTARPGLRVRVRLRPKEARVGAITDIEGFEPAVP